MSGAGWTLRDRRRTAVTTAIEQYAKVDDFPFAVDVPVPPFLLGGLGALVSCEADAEDRAHLIAAAPLLRDALTEARDAIASLPEDALGSGSLEVAHPQTGEADLMVYPIRDELLAKISDALSHARGESEPSSAGYAALRSARGEQQGGKRWKVRRW